MYETDRLSVCTIKSRRRFLLAPAHLDCPGKGGIKRLCECVCMYVVMRCNAINTHIYILPSEHNIRGIHGHTEYCKPSSMPKKLISKLVQWWSWQKLTDLTGTETWSLPVMYQVLYTLHVLYQMSHRIKLKRNLDRVVSQATHDLLLIVLQTVDALACLAATLDALHLALPRPPVVFYLLHCHNHQLHQPTSFYSWFPISFYTVIISTCSF